MFHSLTANFRLVLKLSSLCSVPAIFSMFLRMLLYNCVALKQKCCRSIKYFTVVLLFSEIEVNSDKYSIGHEYMCQGEICQSFKALTLSEIILFCVPEIFC